MSKYKLLDDKKRFATEIDEVLYSMTDEKQVIERALSQQFRKKHYSQALDIGPGPGLISKPLYENCDKLTMLEILPEYQEILQQNYPNAEVIIGSINDTQFNKKFDAIVLAHVLYYFPEDQWPSLVKQLLSYLTEQGELFIVMWDSHFVYDLFMPKVKGLNSITPMMPIDHLTTMLQKLAKVEVIEIPTTMQINNDEQIITLIAHMLGVEYPAVVANCKNEIEQFNSWLVFENGQKVLRSNNILYQLSKA